MDQLQAAAAAGAVLPLPLAQYTGVVASLVPALRRGGRRGVSNLLGRLGRAPADAYRDGPAAVVALAASGTRALDAPALRLLAAEEGA